MYSDYIEKSSLFYTSVLIVYLPGHMLIFIYIVQQMPHASFSITESLF